jgi:hypothetical protein
MIILKHTLHTVFYPKQNPGAKILGRRIRLLQCLACKCPAAILRVCVNPGLLCSNQKDLRWFAGSWAAGVTDRSQAPMNMFIVESQAPTDMRGSVWQVCS